MTKSLSRAAWTAAFAATTLFLGACAYLRMFTSFAFWDDEGFLLISLKSFHQGGRLYDEVYSQYGPFYYQVMDGLFSVLRHPVTHDAGRVISLSVWLALSLVCGLLVFRLTRSLWLGIGVQMLTLKSLLHTLCLEPMHPGGLVCLLLACLAGTAAILPGRPRLALFLQGALLAALPLVKINVGAFAILALGLTCVTAFPALARHRFLSRATAVAVLAAPLGLMAANLGESWAQRYALLVIAGTLAVAVTLFRRGPIPWLEEQGSGSRLLWLAGGAAGTATLICAGIVLRGTTPVALIQALLVLPLRQASVWTVALVLPPGNRKIALLSLGVCLYVTAVRRRPARREGPGEILTAGAGLLRLAVGVAFAASVPAYYQDRPVGFLLAPLAWVAAFPPSGQTDRPEMSYARFLLPPLALLAALHAYPVAGSHISWSSFLFIPIAGICVYDGWGQIARWARAREGWAAVMVRWLSPVMALAAVGLIACSVVLPLQGERDRFRDGKALSLPGSSRIRLAPEQADTLLWVSQEIGQHCKTFISLPGMNSFYFWTRQEPATMLNVGTWMYLFPPAMQDRVLERIRGVDGLCVLRNDNLLAIWARGRPLPDTALLRYLTGGFVPLEERGGYQILVRRPEPALSP